MANLNGKVAIVSGASKGIGDGMRRLVAGADSVKLTASVVFSRGKKPTIHLKGGDQP